MSRFVAVLDETASACFGVHLARWKAAAFTLGNFGQLVGDPAFLEDDTFELVVQPSRPDRG